MTTRAIRFTLAMTPAGTEKGRSLAALAAASDRLAALVRSLSSADGAQLVEGVGLEQLCRQLARIGVAHEDRGALDIDAQEGQLGVLSQAGGIQRGQAGTVGDEQVRVRAYGDDAGAAGSAHLCQPGLVPPPPGRPVVPPAGQRNPAQPFHGQAELTSARVSYLRLVCVL